jgi:cobalt-zinc-cadmium efflux system outer membrane protein
VLQIPLRKRVAAAAFEQTKLDVARAVWEHATNTRAAFYRAQGALQMLDLRRTVAGTTTLAADFAKRQHDAGNATALDLVTEQALDDEARLTLEEAETEVEAAREDLNVLMGVWGDETTWTVPARLPNVPQTEPSPVGLETWAIEQRLDLAAARQELDVLARTVDFTGLYRFLPSGEAGLSAHREPESGFWSTGPAIAFPLPIFDQRQAALASDVTKLRQGEDRYAALAVEIRSEVRRWRTKMLSARRRAEYYRAVALPRYQRIVDETQKQYNFMLSGVFQLLQAKRDEVEAGRKYVESLADYWVSRSELERAIGADFPVEGVVPPPAAMETRGGSR